MGNLLTHTDPNGHTTTTTGYDSQKRPTSILFSDGTLASYTYDTGLKGKVTQLQLSGPESQSITYIYDAFGNVINQTKSLGGDTFSLEYAPLLIDMYVTNLPFLDPSARLVVCFGSCTGVTAALAETQVCWAP
jgi:YD repeat-containing protein